MEKSEVLKILKEVYESNRIEVNGVVSPQSDARMFVNLGVSNMYFSAVYRIATYRGEEHEA